jgi:flagellar biosynthesis GTPase FlhF
VTPYLFKTFLAQGPRSLPALFSALHQVLARGWEQLGPDDNKPTLADSGLLWLFKSIHKHLEFHGRAQDDVWRGWCESCSRPHVQEALQLASELIETLEHRTPGGGGLTRLLQVTGWLTENRELFQETTSSPVRAQAVEQEKAPVKAEKAPVPERRKEEPPAEPEEEEEEEEEEEALQVTLEELEDEEFEDEQPDNEEPEDEEAIRREAPRVLRTRSTPPPELEHSPALEQLLHKLAAFDKLVERQDFSRASVVATDVLHVIDHFDPLVYLPSLFSRFLSGLSAHAGRIEPQMQGSRSLSERALERLYRTDLNAFLNSASGAEEES